MFCSIAPAHAMVLPDAETKITEAGTEQSIVLAGGCFWGVQAVFQHTKGVKQAISGYAGGDASTAQYETVSTGRTGHAEVVKVIYDPAQISLAQLLKVYFSVAHDPTELNRQGPDHGTQYRSAVFYGTEDQKKLAESYIAQLDKAKLFPEPIVTKLETLKGFYPAEEYHQDYLRRHPTNGYIVVNDLPKVEALSKLYPELYIKPY